MSLLAAVQWNLLQGQQVDAPLVAYSTTAELPGVPRLLCAIMEITHLTCLFPPGLLLGTQAPLLMMLVWGHARWGLQGGSGDGDA